MRNGNDGRSWEMQARDPGYVAHVTCGPRNSGPWHPQAIVSRNTQRASSIHISLDR